MAEAARKLHMAEAARKLPPIMHDTDKQDYLAQAERHIAIAQDRIAWQKRIIDKLAQAGQRPIAPSQCSTLSRRVCTSLSSIAGQSSSGARLDGPS